MGIDKSKLKVELVKRETTLGALANQLGLPPTTLSSWLSARHPAPEDLQGRIERALGLRSGALSAPTKSESAARARRMP